MPVTFGAKTAELFEHYATTLLDKQSTMGVLRQRFLTIDEYISRESDRSYEAAAGKMAVQQLGKKNKLRNFEPPVILTKLDTAEAYLASTFLTGFPIFGTVSSKDNADAAAMFQALSGRDQMRFGWIRQLMMVFKDALKYNICGVEVDWYQKYITQAAPTPAGAASKSKTKQTIEFEGNQILRIDPYNLIWDTSVLPADVHAEGMYCGHVRRMNYVAVKGMIDALNNDYKVIGNIKRALAKESINTNGSPAFYQPTIRKNEATGNINSWENYWGFQAPTSRSMSNSTGQYEVLRLYVRIIPKEYDIIAPRSGSPDIYKLIFVNGVLIYGERMEDQFFPIYLCQAVEDGLGMETKSFAENLMDVQDIAAALQNGRIASLRRSISDRALYDPTRINANDINSANPEAKIPVKTNLYNKELNTAYHPIPYRDDMAASFNQEFATIMSFADEISGLNRASQGNFVKGNKTLFEFDTIMQNAQARTQKLAMNMEASMIHNIKERIKANYIKFAVTQQVYDRASKSVVPVDPATLREQEVMYKMSDGLLPNDKLINGDTFGLAIQAMSTVPGLAQQYDVAGMFVYLLKSRGFGDLDDFKLSPGAGQAGSAGPAVQPPAATVGAASPTGTV